MPYIGNEVGNRFVASKAASVYSGDGSTTAFTLEHAVGSDEDILVSVDGVIQEPSVAYAVSSGTTLTFTAAPSTNSGNNIFVYYLFRTVGTIDHPATSALSATSGTFTGNIIIPDDGDIGSTTKTNAIEIASNGNLTFNLTNGTAQAIQNSNGSSIIYGSFTNHGLNFRTNNTLQMAIDTNGHVTMPNQPAFLARPASNQTDIAVGSDVTVVFGTEIFDQNGDFSSNTFTAPVTGRYQLNFNIRLVQLDSAATYYYGQLSTSNRVYIAIFDPDFGQDNEHFFIAHSVLTDMDANDTATIEFRQIGGSQQTDINTNTNFSGFLVA